MFPVRRSTLLCAFVCVGASLVGGAADAFAAECTSSSPNTIWFSDPTGDVAGNTPDIAVGALSTDSGCHFDMGYSMANESSMKTGDYVAWFIDTDNNSATGSPQMFRGADYAVGRLANGYTALSRYNPANGHFDVIKQEQPLGAFGARTNLSDFERNYLSPAFAVYGASSYVDPVTGASTTDFAPDGAVTPVVFGVRFAAAGASQPEAAPPLAQPAAPRAKRRAKSRPKHRSVRRRRVNGSHSRPLSGRSSARARLAAAINKAAGL